MHDPAGSLLTCLTRGQWGFISAAPPLVFPPSASQTDGRCPQQKDLQEPFAVVRPRRTPTYKPKSYGTWQNFRFALIRISAHPSASSKKSASNKASGGLGLRETGHTASAMTYYITPHVQHTLPMLYSFPLALPLPSRRYLRQSPSTSNLRYLANGGQEKTPSRFMCSMLRKEAEGNITTGCLPSLNFQLPNSPLIFSV